jgi:hypothetical protein
MKMIRHQHDRVDRKGPAIHASAKNAPEKVRRGRTIKQSSPSMNDNGEKERSTRYDCAAIIWHASIVGQ